MKTLFYLLSALTLSLLLCTCGSAETEEAPNTITVAESPGAFDDVEEALESGSAPKTIAAMLINNYARVSDDATGRINRPASQQYVDLAGRFADKVDGDTIAALPLYKAAEVYQALNDFEGAAQVFSRIHREYPDFSKSGEALFMLAFTYDENLKDFEKARATYEQFIRDYPKNTFADDAEMLIANLGKSDEEILKSLERPQ